MQEISEVDLRAGQRKAIANESFSAEHFERLLDSHEAVALLRIHPKTLQRLARERRIAGVKVGKIMEISNLRAQPIRPSQNCQLDEDFVPSISTSYEHWASLNLPSVPFRQGELHV